MEKIKNNLDKFFLLKKRIRENDIEKLKNDSYLSLALILRKSFSQSTTKKPFNINISNSYQESNKYYDKR